MTGGAYSQEALEFLAKRDGRQIDKPFDIHELRATVGELVGPAVEGRERTRV